jgi:hypothetical protein
MNKLGKLKMKRLEDLMARDPTAGTLVMHIILLGAKIVSEADPAATKRLDGFTNGEAWVDAAKQVLAIMRGELNEQVESDDADIGVMIWDAIERSRERA